MHSIQNHGCPPRISHTERVDFTFCDEGFHHFHIIPQSLRKSCDAYIFQGDSNLSIITLFWSNGEIHIKTVAKMISHLSEISFQLGKLMC